MKKYVLVSKWNAEDFQKEVNRLLTEGYKLHGSMATSGDNDGDILFTREMVLEDGCETIPESEWI